MKNICVIGLGYIGLPTAVMLGLNGYNVIGVDINENVINSIKSGKAPILEPYLANIQNELIAKEHIILKNTPTECDAFIICVPTPIQSNKTCDLSNVLSAIDSIIPILKKGNIIIIESTIPPTTTRSIIKPLLEKTGLIVGKDIYLAFAQKEYCLVIS